MLSRTIDGAKMRALREDRCLSVAQLAEAAGCTTWNIYNIENGRNQPSAQVYAGIREALEVEDDELAQDAA